MKLVYGLYMTTVMRGRDTLGQEQKVVMFLSNISSYFIAALADYIPSKQMRYYIAFKYEIAFETIN